MKVIMSLNVENKIYYSFDYYAKQQIQLLILIRLL